MSLLAPLFLLGLAGIALPLWLHRLQTQKPERLPISSVMLLAQSEQRLHVQKKLRFLLLLSLRILLLALVALAFAQPLWKLAAGAGLIGKAREHLIIIDNSLSMSAEGRLDAARAAADSIIGELAGGDRAQIAAAGSSIELQVAGSGGASADKAALRRALAQIRPGAGRLEYATAIGAIDSLATDSQLPLVVHLISDFQASGLSPRFADLLPHTAQARPVELQLHAVAAMAAPNYTIAAVRAAADGIHVTVRGHGTPAAPVAVHLRVNDVERGVQRQTAPADGEVTLQFTGIALNAGDNRVLAQLEPADPLVADDAHYAVLQGGGAQAVPLLTADIRGPSVTYIGAALNVAAARYRAQALRIGEFDARTLERYRWVLVDDIGALDAALANGLQKYLESGGAVLAASGARAAALQTLPLTGQSVRGVTVRNADPLSIGRVDGTHALLVNTSGWQNLSVARMLKVDAATADRVLIASEDGEPLLLERRIGTGRLLLLTSSLDNAWNDLPVQPVFVNFIAEAARWLAGDDAAGVQQLTGALLQLPTAGGGAVQVVDPEGRELLSLSATRSARSLRLPRSGIYRLVTPARETLIAVNSDPRESDLLPIDEAALTGWRNAAAAAQAVAPEEGSVQAESGSLPLAQWLLLLLALVVVAESLAGNWLLRRGTGVPS